jgi:hypothetical protein
MEAGSGEALSGELGHWSDANIAGGADEQVVPIDGGNRPPLTEIPGSLLPRVRMQVASDSTKANRRVPVLAFVTGGLVFGAIVLSSPSLRHSAVSRSAGKAPAARSIQSAVNREPTGLPIHTSSIQVAPSPERIVSRRERFVVDRVTRRSAPEVLVSSEEAAGLRRYADFLRAKSNEAQITAAINDAV